MQILCTHNYLEKTQSYWWLLYGWFIELYSKFKIIVVFDGKLNNINRLAFSQKQRVKQPQSHQKFRTYVD